MTTHYKALACMALALGLASCAQNGVILKPHADRAQTNDLTIDSPDAVMVLGRVTGEDTGVKLLGLIPLKTPSETIAVDRMYENARKSGAEVEGHARQFANTSLEHSSRNNIIFTTTKVRATGDVIQFNGSKGTQTKDGKPTCCDGGSSSGSSSSGGTGIVDTVTGMFSSILDKLPF